MILDATGTKARPSLSFYDAGEGQHPADFPRTFCSLIYGSDEGSYKGAVPFAQGRFNMGGTGVLPFCGDDRKMQLIVSRVPDDMCKDPHEWGFHHFLLLPLQIEPVVEVSRRPRRQRADRGFRPGWAGPETRREVRRTLRTARAPSPERHAHQNVRLQSTALEYLRRTFPEA